MKKIHLQPMIKYPPSPDSCGIVLITIVLSLAFAAAVAVTVMTAMDREAAYKIERRV